MVCQVFWENPGRRLRLLARAKLLRESVCRNLWELGGLELKVVIVVVGNRSIAGYGWKSL